MKREELNITKHDIDRAFGIAEYCWEEGSPAYNDLIEEAETAVEYNDLDLEEFREDVYSIMLPEVSEYKLKKRHLEMLFKATVGAIIMYPGESIRDFLK